jgi:hypothetical protein
MIARTESLRTGGSRALSSLAWLVAAVDGPFRRGDIHDEKSRSVIEDGTGALRVARDRVGGEMTLRQACP